MLDSNELDNNDQEPKAKFQAWGPKALHDRALRVAKKCGVSVTAMIIMGVEKELEIRERMLALHAPPSNNELEQKAS